LKEKCKWNTHWVSWGKNNNHMNVKVCVVCISKNAHKGPRTRWKWSLAMHLRDVPCIVIITHCTTWTKFVYLSFALLRTTSDDERTKKRVYIWKLCYFQIYIGFKFYKILPNWNIGFNQPPLFLIHWNLGSN